MNRKKALYRYEFGNMKWLLIAGLGCSLVVLFILNTMYSQTVNFGALAGEGYFEIGYSATFSDILSNTLTSFTPMAIVAVSVMTIFQFSDYHKRDRREYIVSLPFTQRERFVSKFAVGSGILTVVCAVFGTGVMLLRAQYYNIFLKKWLTHPEYRLLCGNDTWFHAFRAILLLWIVMLTVYAICIVIHSLVTVGVIATFISLGVIASPIYLLWMFGFYVDAFSEHFDSAELVNGTFAQICRALIGDGYYRDNYVALGEDAQEAGMYSYSQITYTDYGSMGIVFLALIVILIACAILAYVINIKQDGAKFGRLIPIKGARIFISVGMAICFSFPVAGIAAFCFALGDSTWGLLILQIILAAVLFSVNQRIFQRVTR